MANATDFELELHRAMVGMVVPLKVIRDTKNKATREEKQYADALKEYLEQHPELDEGNGREVVDGEHHVRAFLVEKRSADTYDTVSMAEQAPSALIALARLGLVSINTRALSELRKGPGMIEIDGSTIDRFKMPGSVSVALHVGEVK